MKKFLSLFSFVFYFPIDLRDVKKSVPEYYFDDSLSDREKLIKDWEMIREDWNK